MPYRPLRPLAVVVSLALGDYLLWDWSLGANHDILALVSGMALVPLLLASVWLLVLAGAHLLARALRRPAAGARHVARTVRRPAAGARTRRPRPVAGMHSTLRDPSSASAGEVRAATSSSSKIAA